MPPNEATVPGAYDFRQVAWFDGLGATGKGSAPVKVLTPGTSSNGLRAALAAHIESKIEGSAGGIAAALAAGDEGAISQEDSDAMRRSGLAHLLSVSGLHITAVVVALAALLWVGRSMDVHVRFRPDERPHLLVTYPNKDKLPLPEDVEAGSAV